MKSRDEVDRWSRPIKPGHSRWWLVGWVLAGLAVVGGVGRALLPWALRDYVNGTLDRSPLYSGTIGKVRVHLWRGAYSIQDVRISKTSGDLPTPFFGAKRVDFAIEWNALFHHRVVGRMVMAEPEINFIDARNEGESQTGANGPWLRIIRDLFPFKINGALVHNGAIHFRSYQGEKPVDVFLSKVEASIDNLTNIRDQPTPLPATVKATAVAMDQAKLEYRMVLDPFSYRPTFHMALRLLGLDVTRINDLALTYGNFDFKRGWFDLVIETDAKNGQLSGYAKPLFRNLKVFNLSADVQEDKVLQFFWQALIGAATSVFKNQSRDQFGTLIPFTVDASTTTTADIFATVGNVLRNAFIRAYLPRLESPPEPGPLTFGAPEFGDLLSLGGTP